MGEAALKLKGNFGVAKELVFLIFLTPKTGTPELLRSPAPKTGTPELQVIEIKLQKQSAEAPDFLIAQIGQRWDYVINNADEFSL